MALLLNNSGRKHVKDVYITRKPLFRRYCSISLFNCCSGIWSKFHEEALISGYAKRGAWTRPASRRNSRISLTSKLSRARAQASPSSHTHKRIARQHPSNTSRLHILTNVFLGAPCQFDQHVFFSSSHRRALGSPGLHRTHSILQCAPSTTPSS